MNPDSFRLQVREHSLSELRLDPAALAPLLAHYGRLAVVDLETTGLSDDPESEILEIGAVLLDPGEERALTVESLVRPKGSIPRAVKRLTGLDDGDVAHAPGIEELRDELHVLLADRILIAHNAEFERNFLSRFVGKQFDGVRYLDTLDLLAITHPDAPDLRLESFTRMLLASEEHHRALQDALDTARVISRAASGAHASEHRYVMARRALEIFAPQSPWLPLLASDSLPLPASPPPEFVAIPETQETPVPFDEEAIAAVLEDEARGRRHFEGYRVRPEQIRLARCFVRSLSDGGVALLEGGTGVGKSLAYLAAAIPFAWERAAGGIREPIVISTRTKLLQDQLLGKDIAASAAFLGYGELQALSIKGRANYVCQKRLDWVLDEGREASLFPAERMSWAALFACAHIRPHGEIGSIPAALLRRTPALRDLLRRSVSVRSELCTREECARQPGCPFGRRRAALARAHLVVANHDLLLRWPPDYPAFTHVIVDEVHDLADVADDAYALEVRPEALLDQLDDLFGRPGDRRKQRGLLPRAARRNVGNDATAWRRDLHQELRALGRSLRELSSEFGDVEVPRDPGPDLATAAGLAKLLAERLEFISGSAEELVRDSDPDEQTPVERITTELRGAAEALRLTFAGDTPDAVATFEGVVPPFDRWRLVVRPVSPAPRFHEEFLDRRESFAGVSASLFVEGDAFAALGELEIEERAGERLFCDTVPSPFPYDTHMRAVALESSGDLVNETAEVLEILARKLGGRTLGLFTSLRRMHEVADILSARLRTEGIDVLAPRRAFDDPSALVTRFKNGAAVLLGARKFWQGLDIPGDCLQAVVIEKLPFEVPTELRRRREQKVAELGMNPFQRYSLGKMLLNLKQMTGRLIRSEEDRGIVVIVEGRTDRRYFRRLSEALPPGTRIRVVKPSELGAVLDEVAIND